MTVELAAFGPGIVSDACKPLICMYQAVRDGWDPPAQGTLEDYEAAQRLPDEDPRKAFFGFGASYGAKWFGGWAGDVKTRWIAKESRWHTDDPIGATRRALLRSIPKLAQCRIVHADFMTWEPDDAIEVVYIDPPFAGTTGYGSVPPLDLDRMWTRCQQLADKSRVIVGEYDCPIEHDEIWQRVRAPLMINAGTGLDRRTRRHVAARVEKLHLIHPSDPTGGEGHW